MDTRPGRIHARGGGEAPPYHDWEDDGSHCGLEDPEHRQAEYLHQGEEVDSAQGHVTQEGMVRLVLGRHQEELAALPELVRTARGSASSGDPGGSAWGFGLWGKGWCSGAS